MMKVYVAGAYSDSYILNIFENMRIGIETSAKLVVMGYAPYCPWLDFHYFLSQYGDKINEEKIKNYSIEWLKVCDAMLLVNNPRNKDSKGTYAEIQEAKKLDIPIFKSIDELIAHEIVKKRKGKKVDRPKIKNDSN